MNLSGISTKNDGKSKYQSWEATVTVTCIKSMSHTDLAITAYGATEDGAIANLKTEIHQLMEDLNRLVI